MKFFKADKYLCLPSTFVSSFRYLGSLITSGTDVGEMVSS